MKELDPRLYVFRQDLAAVSLRDRVRAQRYAEGEIRQVAAFAAPIRVAPKFDAALATEALSGERLTVYDSREGWAWVQLRNDGYVGYTPLDGLSTMVEENTHRVSGRLTYVYPAPDVKRPPITKLSFSSTVLPLGKPEGRFVELSRGGFIFTDHLVGIGERAKDFVRVAERFVGVPYLWGGKTTLGVDCSGLVQISLHAAGIPCLRDTDMQMTTAGEPVDRSNLEAIQRGDLLLWRGHVAVAQSADWMVHASGHHMEVVVEQIRRAVERIAETHGPLVAILRPRVEQKTAGEQKAPATAQAGPSPKDAAQTPPQPAPPGKEGQGAPSAQGKAASTGTPAPSSPAPASESQAAKPAQAVAGSAPAAMPSSPGNEREERLVEAQQDGTKSARPSEKSIPAAPEESPKGPAKQPGVTRG
jgi:cell wall-associated NlpC family hydrolase